MWTGYFEYAGVEFSNGLRTEAYARNANYYGLRPQHQDSSLASTLGDTYTDPQADNAPWYDADIPESKDFLGVYVIDVTGLGDSTAASTTFENTGDGGMPGRPRLRARNVVFNAALLASSEAGVEYGQAWLAQVLTFPECDSPIGCNGDVLTYFARSSAEESDKRSLRRVAFNSGPTVATRRTGSCGTHIWMVTFTAYAGDPNIYGTTRAVVRDFAATSPTSPYTAPGVTTKAASPGFVDPTCSTVVATPLYDPLRPAMSPPPQYPEIPLNEYVPGTTWNRYALVIPASWIPVRGELIPTVSVTSKSDAPTRNVRVRFYPATSGGNAVDECAWSGDMVFTYLPSAATITVDGPAQEVYAITSDGLKRNADSLVLQADGTPLTIPILTCGTGYLVTVDQQIDALAAPVLNTPTQSTTGGTLTAGTYYYKLTAVTANGETTGSNQVSRTTSGSTSRVIHTWAEVAGATQYKLYRSTTSNGQSTSPALVATIDGDTLTYTDTGTAVKAGSVPSNNTTQTPIPEVDISLTTRNGIQVPV